MNDFDKLFNDGMSKEKIDKKEHFDKTDAEKRSEFFEWLKGLTDWFRVPLNFLIGGLLLIGGILMFDSIYLLTGNIFVALLSPVVSEIGIISWEVSRERTKNTELQTKIAAFQRLVHILSSVTLLVINFVVETAQEILSIRIDGVIWVIFGIIGLVALLDLIQYFRFNDADRESSAKRKFQQKIDVLKAETKEKQLEAFAESERIKSQSLVTYWRENAPELAKILGEIEASKKIREAYKDMGLSEEQIESYMNKIKLKTGYVVESKNQATVTDKDDTNPDTITYSPESQTQIPQKRKYTRRQIPPTSLETSEKISEEQPEENKEENFTNGVKNDQEDW